MCFPLVALVPSKENRVVKKSSLSQAEAVAPVGC